MKVFLIQPYAMMREWADLSSFMCAASRILPAESTGRQLLAVFKRKKWHVVAIAIIVAQTLVYNYRLFLSGTSHNMPS